MSINFCTIVFLSLTLNSCGDTEPTKDVAYYKAHPENRKQKIVQCEKQLKDKVLQSQKEGKQELTPESLKLTGNCKNAMEAEHQTNFGEDGAMPKIK